MFNRASLLDIVKRTRADLMSRLGIDDLLRRADAEVLSRVLAGISHEIHGYLDWIARQVLYDTSDEEILLRQASAWGVERKEAEFAAGNGTATGIAGRTILTGTLIRSTDGVEYLVESDVVMTGAPVSVPVKAIVAAAAGNAVEGTELKIVQPIDGVTSQLTVAEGGLVNGSDIETIPDFRARFLRQIQQPTSGGAKQDYITWALEVPGVTRAWVYPAELGAGTVTVRFLRDNDASPIPDPAEVQAVQDYIENVYPVTAELFVVAPVAVPVTFEISVTPGSAQVKAAVEAELRDLLLREAEPGKTILLSHITEAISIAAGEDDHVLIYPTENLTFITGRIATFGGIEWA